MHARSCRVVAIVAEERSLASLWWEAALIAAVEWPVTVLGGAAVMWGLLGESGFARVAVVLFGVALAAWANVSGAEAQWRNPRRAARRWRGSLGVPGSAHELGLRSRAGVPSRLSLVQRLPDGAKYALRLPDGVTAADVQDRAAAIADALDAASVEIESAGIGEVSLYAFANDPLAAVVEPVEWDGDWRRLPVGRTRSGDVACVRVAENSGTVVGGLPGGGKTAGLGAMFAPLVKNASVQFAIFDGKGGADWSWLRPRASRWTNEDEDRAAVADSLEALVQVMRNRLATIMETRGGSSLWNTGGPSVDMPLLVVVVDECQSWLDAGAVPRGDKDAKEHRDRAEAALAALVRKGRSAGIWTIVATQKPTSDSLPTTIGTNAAAAICFRVKTPEAERAVLGSAPGDLDPRATDLPDRPGMAVLAREDGTRGVVRLAYVDEAELATTARDAAHLRREI